MEQEALIHLLDFWARTTCGFSSGGRLEIRRSPLIQLHHRRLNLVRILFLLLGVSVLALILVVAQPADALLDRC